MKLINVDSRFCTKSLYMWPSHRECIVKYADLSQPDARYNFIIPEKEKSKIESVYFICCPGEVKHIPLEIFDEFPALNGLIVSLSRIPVIRSDMFKDPRFAKIEYLGLFVNRVRYIEEDAFAQMTNLKWIYLGGNRLLTMDHNYFRYNKKLEYVNLWNNRFSTVNPTIFDGLEYLKIVKIEIDKCLHEVGTKTSLIDYDELNEAMKTFYQNYIRKKKWLADQFGRKWKNGVSYVTN